jgi:diol dehydratase reactivase alpha subunit
MKLFAGVDIGNSTTEACVAFEEMGKIKFLSSGITSTTGVKGTVQNVSGVILAIEEALRKINRKISDLNEIRINEAAPVIGDTAMETITETIITDSTMIGHNPSTPGGAGLGIGYTVLIHELERVTLDRQYIVIIPAEVSYEEAARIINKALLQGKKIHGAIVERDEAVLISNRIGKKIPILDEVKGIDKIPKNTLAAVEVADGGHTIKTLSNPYGIATIFNLTSEETRRIVPVAKSLTGIRSAVVIKTPSGEVREKIIPAGTLSIVGCNSCEYIDVDAGAEEIMKVVQSTESMEDVIGEPATNIGGMISSVKSTMAELTSENIKDVKIKDLLAVDTYLPVKVTGGLAGETFLEKAVAVAAMVKIAKLPMKQIANLLERETGVRVKIAGVEAVMAVLGALTTPGVSFPVAVVDLGGGSTDAALLDEKGTVKSVHLAGAGELVTMLINSELGLNDRTLAEEIKKYPVAKVESLFHIRMENGEFKFFDSPLEAKYFGRIVVLKDNMIPIYRDLSIERIIEIRRSAKYRVLVQNAVRALRNVAAMNNIKNIANVVLVGGSALDFEAPDMILKELSKYRIVTGRGNIRGSEGPRNAVATGLAMSRVMDDV